MTTAARAASIHIEDDNTEADAVRDAHCTHPTHVRQAREVAERAFYELLSGTCPHLASAMPSYKLTRPEISKYLHRLHCSFPHATICGTPTIRELLVQFTRLYIVSHTTSQITVPSLP